MSALIDVACRGLLTSRLPRYSVPKSTRYECLTSTVLVPSEYCVSVLRDVAPAKVFSQCFKRDTSSFVPAKRLGFS